ncbi:unnamed protein product [Rotaria socialis]|uniref:Serine/threonine-protein phosphatase PGAM5, mitochondrial n=1 Tax=Rotaria socialis TaxID=392032 RepID=A0A818C2Y2_9BILA|nr:unnamed protein product [Rotaria socialis]CAF3426430.1 unnamed protein product [Rotaria socialis]CAF3484302.1 unnamed protein product [Rotaria socialis]CAF3508261.1 unnamed protein product [Rotaria socialis]CAF3689375.1 unnamed protein product [Rotaria socialis]
MRFITKLVTTTVGVVCTTASAYLFIDEKKRHRVLFAATISQAPNNNNNNDIIQPDQQSLSSPIKSSDPWNWNWDGRHSDMNKTRIVRHIYLIRHGQYQTKTKVEDQKQLTELGNEQADWAGLALAESKIPFTRFIQSGLIRAVQTASIINKHIKFNRIEQDIDLNEGFPFLPEPAGRFADSVATGRIELETERMERAFRRYIHRPLTSQTEDSHELIVCHANVIRYFVCRALQIPADAWLRFNLFHCSITHLVFTSDGRVICYGIGDVGHVPQERRSLRRPSRKQSRTSAAITA